MTEYVASLATNQWVGQAGSVAFAGSAGEAGGGLANTTTGIAYGWPPSNSNSQAQMQTIFEEVADTGATWIRFDFDWWSVQANSTSWDWTWLDKLVGAATAAGLNILGLPTYTPPWAAVGGVHKAAPTDPALYAEFCRRCVERYTQIDYWECGNEVNLSGFWVNPDPDDYAQNLVAAYDAIKGERAEAQVGFAGLAPAGIRPSTFLQGCYDATTSVAGHFDFICYHPYPAPVSPLFDHPDNGWGLASGKLQTLRDVLVAEGDGDIPMWATEFGYPSAPSLPGGQASAIVTDANANTWTDLAFDEWRAKSWTGPLFYYMLRDINSSDLSDAHNVYGLKYTNGTGKPVLATFTAAS